MTPNMTPTFWTMLPVGDPNRISINPDFIDDDPTDWTQYYSDNLTTGGTQHPLQIHSCRTRLCRRYNLAHHRPLSMTLPLYRSVQSTTGPRLKRMVTVLFIQVCWRWSLMRWNLNLSKFLPSLMLMQRWWGMPFVLIVGEGWNSRCCRFRVGHWCQRLLGRCRWIWKPKSRITDTVLQRSSTSSALDFNPGNLWQGWCALCWRTLCRYVSTGW